MIWHIFRKDLKLLWPMVLGVALINLIESVIRSSLGPFFYRASPLRNLSNILGEIAPLLAGILVLMAVLQDAIPGLRQDWLVRPIRRRDLMLGKILFVVLAVQGPVFMIETAQGVAAGFTPWQSLSASFSRNLWTLLSIDLPVIAFATLTRSLTEAIGTGLVVFLGFAAIMTSVPGLHAESAKIGWIVDSAQVTWGLLAVAAVVGLQFFRRKIIAARWIFGSSAIVWLFVQLLPWQPAFAIQERLSTRPAAAQSVRIAFEPALGRFERRPGAQEPQRVVMSGIQRDALVYVPLRADGVGDGRMLVADRMKPRFTEPGGTVVELPEVGGGTQLDAHQLMFVPEDIYNGIKDQPVRLELDYSLTLLQAGPAQSMPALSGAETVPGVGRCATRVSSGGTQFELGCLAPGKVPCFTWTLGDYENNACRPDYAPWFVRGDEYFIHRFGGAFLFRNPAKQSQPGSERIMFHVYGPEAHFTRQVVIPDVRLGDWTAKWKP